MDVLAIVLACSLHPDDGLVRALVDVQSSGNVFFVGDLATLKTNESLSSAEAALRYAEDLVKHGGRPAVGLLGIPLSWAARHGKSSVELFDGCTNVAIGTAAFAEYHARCTPAALRPSRERARLPRASRRARNRDVGALRACVLSRFALDLGLTATPSAILRRLGANVGAPSGRDRDSPPERSLMFADGVEGERGEATRHAGPRLFLDSPAPPSSTR